ncbi:hypothetical protein L2E82_22863 [Cichorium intybus]|uniref:Uncharacterized protein n=1 Tax=Cichorium intybus TaxID=13427 RepID=A0ACB9DYY6_CICIN|nr:hypothetical protein L2E82_22863 [Cichorium intybus]
MLFNRLLRLHRFGLVDEILLLKRSGLQFPERSGGRGGATSNSGDNNGGTARIMAQTRCRVIQFKALAKKPEGLRKGSNLTTSMYN